MPLKEFVNTYVASATYIAVVDGFNEPYFEGRARQLKNSDNYYDIANARVIEVFSDKNFPGVLAIYIDATGEILE